MTLHKDFGLAELGETAAGAAKQIHGLLAQDSRFTTDQCEKLSAFAGMVLQKNEVMNLTAITDPDEFYAKHIVDSLTLLPLIDEVLAVNPAPKLLDLGSGAGFPGIPLKIMRPQLQIVLLDSLQKRVRFLTDVITALELENISAVHARAEEAGRQKTMRESFDLVTARAVAGLPTLLELCLPFVVLNGHFWAMKSNLDEAAGADKALRILGGCLAARRQFTLPLDQGERVILDFLKSKPTPATYPRKPGLPGKNPLM